MLAANGAGPGQARGRTVGFVVAGRREKVRYNGVDENQTPGRCRDGSPRPGRDGEQWLNVRADDCAIWMKAQPGMGPFASLGVLRAAREIGGV